MNDKGNLSKIGNGIKDAAGGFGNGMYKLGPSTIGSAVNLVLPDALGGDAFEQNIEDGRGWLEELYGVNTNSSTYRWFSTGTQIASVAIGGAGAAKATIGVAKAARGARVNAAARAPSVIRVGELTLPGVPKGVTGTPTTSGKGLEYAIPRGTPEIDPRVASIRVMDPVTVRRGSTSTGTAMLRT